MDIPFLSSALSYVRKNGSLPPRLKSKEDLNEAFDSGVDGETIAQLRADVGNRLLEKQQQRTAPSTLAFLEGFLLYSPPEAEVEEHVLRSVHRNIDVHLFLPAPYDIVKARRESRSGYVTTGPQPPVPTGAEAAVSSESKEVDLEAEDDRPPQNFWTDPPGYVDDIVWPRYVQDHSWLLLPEADSQDDDLVKRMGQGVNVRSDAGVIVAPGQGSKPAADILKWAVEEIMKYLLAE
ncbi:ribosylnicotinamide kinase [Aspergillus wentii]|nr:ribosylnicotinamide kinase [Aspergillus wentii]